MPKAVSAAKKTGARAAAAKPAAKAAPATRAAAKGTTAKRVAAKPAAAKRTTVKPAVAKPAAQATKAVKAVTPAAKPAARTRAKTAVAKPLKNVKLERPAAEQAKSKLVRDSFTMPEQEYAVLAKVKQACLKAGLEVKKSELLRIGVALISQIDLATLQQVLGSLPQLKTGRPRG